MEVILGVVINIILARVLGPANFGVYTLWGKICNVAGLLARAGVGDVIVKYVGITSGSGEWAKLKGYISISFKIIITGSVITVALITVCGKSLAINLFSSPALYDALIFSILVIPLQNSLFLTREIFRGWQDLKTASFIPVWQQLAFLVLVAFLTLAGMVYVSFVLVALSAGIFCSLAVALSLLRRRLREKRPGPEKIKVPDLLQESLPMMATRGSLLLMSGMDIYMLGIYTNPGEVGIYGVVGALAALTVFFHDIVNQVIPAMIARYNAQDDFAALSYIMRYASTLGAIFSLPILILVLLGGKLLLVVIFGPMYAGGVAALNILVFGRLLTSCSGSGGYLLQMTGFHIIMTGISVCCGLLNFILNLVLVRHYGKEGVAAATAFSLVVQNILVLVMARRKTGIWALASAETGKEILKNAWGYLKKLSSGA